MIDTVGPLTFVSDPLRPAADRAQYDLHCAALEWSLVDPIVIESLDDVQSKVEWRDGFEPFHHQVQNLVTFCRSLPVTLVADDVGLGKTITAALILCELMKRRRVGRTLVLCPSILRQQWVEELHAKVGIISGTATGREVEALLRGSLPVVVTTYETMRERIARIPPGSFDLVILDEAHKLRNLHGTPNPPILAQSVHAALSQRLFKYVLMLTATPIQNRVWDLYSLIDCLTVAKGHRNPLGSPAEFSAEYIADPPTGRRLNPKNQDKFRRELQKYIVRTRREDARLAFPERRVDMFLVDATPVERHFQRLLADHIQGLNGLEQSSLAVALMSSPQAFAAQVENMAATRYGWEELAADVRAAVDGGGRFAKEDGLLEIVRTLREQRPHDWRIVIFTGRKETQRAIGALLTEANVPHGFIQGAQPERNARTIAGFMNDPPQVSALVSTDAGAEGINLQKCNVLVNYDLPWNPMVVEQRIGRVQRLASAHKYVSIFNLCIADSPEEHVVGRLMEKLQTISQTVGDIEAILESAFPGATDGERSFAAQVRKLVVKSLVGQDVRQATQLAVSSVEQGKRLLREHEAQFDEQLGPLDAIHWQGPAAPRLARFEPSVTAEEFVTRALAVEGGDVRADEEGLYTVRYRDGTLDRLTFSEDVWRRFALPGAFQGVAPKLFQPGKPAFERLVQRWVDRAAYRLEVGEDGVRRAREVANDWLAQCDDTSLTAFDFVSDDARVEATALVRATALNAVDSYEKLLSIPFATTTADDRNARSQLAAIVRDAAPLEPEMALPGFGEAARRHVAADPDLEAFCRFYAARLDDELRKAGNPADGGKKLRQDFAPQIRCEVAGLSGRVNEAGRATVRFRVGGEGDYVATVAIDPHEYVVLDAPPIAQCSESKRFVPDLCLETCAYSGARALAHLMTTSEETGRRGLARLASRCPVTGRLTFAADRERCELSGRNVARSALAASAVSGRRALASLLVRCEITGADVFPDELVKSEISGRRFRRDEQSASAVSRRRGHTSEFVRCVVTGDVLLAAEAGTSEVSGRPCRRNLLVRSDRPSGRAGLPSEIVVCAKTKRRLLLDEVDVSVISGNYIDRELLSYSPASGRAALPEEFVRCEATGVALLPDEVAVCSVTGKTVDRRRLVSSDVSGRLALANLFHRCEESGRCALPAELVRCEATGRRVAQDLTGVCAITRKRVLATHLATSAVSGRRFLANLAETVTLTKQTCAPDEVSRCRWSGETVLKQDVVRCAWTGLTIHRKFQGPSGALVAFETMLLRNDAGKGGSHFAEWLQQNSGAEIRGIQSVRFLKSPGGVTHAFVCEMSRFLGLSREIAAFVLSPEGGHHFLGTIAFLKIRGGRAQLVRQASPPPSKKLVASQG